MAKRTISTRLAIEGEAQYKQAITAINAELRNHKSALDLVNSQYKGNANSMEALQSKQKALSDLQSTQTGKIEKLKAAYQNAQTAVDAYSDKKEELTQKIEANEAALENLKNAEGDTTEEQKKLTEETEKLKKELAENEGKLTAAKKGVNTWETSLNKAKIELNDTNDEIKKNDKYLEEASDSADKCATSIDKYGKEVKQAGDESEKSGGKTKKFADDSKRGFGDVAGALKAAGIAAAVKAISDSLMDCAKSSIEFESAMTGVAKTTDLTDIGLARMGDDLKNLSTQIPVAAKDLASIAENAGQLGIQNDNIVGFTKVMADLGVATNLSGEEAAQSLAKFANVTGMSQSNFDRLGSSIVALGNNMATTEADIAAMAQRLAASGTLAGLTESEILALAASMSSVGIEAEAGGTAMTQTFSAIETAVVSGGENLDEFARISGMSSNEFATKWKTAPMEAIQAFLSGLGNLESQGESATLVLEDMGLSGVRQSNMLKSLGLASEQVAEAASLSNAAWKENTALAEEAELRYGTTESKLEMMSNAFENVKAAVGDRLTPAMGALADIGTDVLEWLGDNITALNEATTRTEDFTRATERAKDRMAESEDRFADTNKAIESNAAVTGRYINRLDELESEMKSLAAQGKSTTEQQTQYKLVVDQINKIMPDLNAEIDEQTGLLKDGTVALRDNVKAMREQARQAALQDRYTELLKAEADTQVELLENKEKLKIAEEEELELRKMLSEMSIYERGLVEIGDWTVALQTGTDGLYSQNDAVEALKESIEIGTEAHGEATKALEEFEGVLQNTTEDTEGLTTKQTEQVEVVSALQTKLGDLTVAYDEAYLKALESTDGQTETFADLEVKVEKSVGGMIDTWKGQQDFYATYNDNLRKLSKWGVDEGLVAAWSDGSVESAGYIQAIVDEVEGLGATEEVLGKDSKKFVDNFNAEYERTEEARKTWADNIASMQANFDESLDEIEKRLDGLPGEMDKTAEAARAGNNTVNGYLDKLRTGIEKARDVGYRTGKAYESGVKNASEIRSPSKVMERIAGQTLDGALLEYERRMDEMQAAGEKTARAFAEGYVGSSMRENVLLSQPRNIYVNQALPQAQSLAKHVNLTINTTDLSASQLSYIVNYVNRELGGRIA